MFFELYTKSAMAYYSLMRIKDRYVYLPVALIVGALLSYGLLKILSPIAIGFLNLAGCLVEMNTGSRTDVLDYSCLSAFMLFIVSFVISLIIFLFSMRLCSRKVIVRDASYVLESLSSRNKRASLRLPATSRQELIERIAGDARDLVDVSEINSFIDSSIEPIKEFLLDKSPFDTLVLNSKWGTGKTTSVLIAINESLANRNRYIYESVFKYTDGVAEFSSDLLNAINAVLLELGVATKFNFIDLINNYSADHFAMVSNLIGSLQKSNPLTSDLIQDINRLYGARKMQNRLYIIIDDIDRLQGADILRVLSLLSTLRRLDFVRLILPADIDIVAQSLQSLGIPNPGLFVNKYLSEQQSIDVDFGYELAETVALAKIERMMKRSSLSDGGCPIFAAVLLKIMSKKLWAETRNLNQDRAEWLTQNSSVKLPENLSRIARRMLTTAPQYMYSMSGNVITSENYTAKYNWKSTHTSLRHFENIIYSVIFRDDGRFVCDNFSYDIYCALIDSWVFSYAEKHWREFDLTLRDVLDTLDVIDFSNMPSNAEARFAKAFGYLFPRKRIAIVKNNISTSSDDRQHTT